MKKARLISVALFVVASFTITSPVSASLMLMEYDSGTATPGVIGGYTMKNFDVTYAAGASDTNSILSPWGDALTFHEEGGAPLNMTHSSAESSSTWWKNGEQFSYDIYTTHEPVVTLLLPENTRAFSLNVGARLNSPRDNAWLTAESSEGPGIDTEYWFNVSKANTPGFGIYATGGECSSIASITIDPLLWGFGNFSINQDSCSAKVPEPSVIALFVAGLFGLGFARRRMSN
jgi:hypothetical protein